MKKILHQIILLTLLNFVVNGQIGDDLNFDSINPSLKTFISSVEKIEIVQIVPYCHEESRFIDSLNEEKKIEICFEESIIRCKDKKKGVECKIDRSHIGKTVKVEKQDIHTLFNILYVTEKVDYLTNCYMPRHGILLFDQNDNQLGFIEICFECERMIETENIPEIGLISNSAYSKLRELFDKYGL